MFPASHFSSITDPIGLAAAGSARQDDADVSGPDPAGAWTRQHPLDVPLITHGHLVPVNGAMAPRGMPPDRGAAPEHAHAAVQYQYGDWGEPDLPPEPERVRSQRYPELDVRVDGSLFPLLHMMRPGLDARLGPVVYLTDAAREKCRLQCYDDGTLRDCEGELFDTRYAIDNEWFTGQAAYVLEPDGAIYASLSQMTGLIHHSSLTAGRPVACAGEIVVMDGIVHQLSNKSGHYLPEPEQLQQCVDYLCGTMGLRTAEGFEATAY